MFKARICLPGKRPRAKRLDCQPGRSCAVPFLPGGWHSRLCGKKDGTIITSYFDEGVFGNYGWDEPLGACGLIAWTSEGTPLWKNEKYSIYDCYAISLDEEENLWFYYYDEFQLVRTTFKEDLVFEPPIEGSGAFSVAPSGDTFLFQGGYQEHNKFYFLTLTVVTLGKSGRLFPPVTETKSLWSSAVCFAAGCCSSGKTAFSMAGYLVKARHDNG